MHMRATITGKSLASHLVVPEQEWRNLGNALRLRIIQRTRMRGEDADGATFQPYSAGYAKAKGKRGGLIGGGRVNLTGVSAGVKMLDAITVLSASAVTNPRVVVGFALTDKDQIAQYHMGEGRVDRKFFALSDDDLDFGVAYIRKRVQASTP
jgi:hypothetical protein